MKKLLLIVFLCGLTACFGQTSKKGAVSCVGTCYFAPPVVTVQTTSLPGGTQGIAYSQTLVPIGGAGPWTWASVVGSPPPGTSLATNGIISGTPTAPGTFTFQAVATDSNGVPSNPRTLSITIVSGFTLTINNTGWANFPFTKPYSAPISVSGGSGTGYVCTPAAGGTGLPAGVTVNTNCTIGLQATSVGGTPGNTYTFKLHVVDSASNVFTSPTLYAVQVIQPCGPPNYGCAGRAVVNDNCIMQIFGAGASQPGCPPTPTSIPNLNNGSATCTQGTNCSATDPQYNNIFMTRCTDAQLNGTITAAPFVNRPYSVGLGGSGDSNPFTTDSSMMAVFDSGSRFIIETIDTTAHTCYPILNGTALFLPGAGEFGGTTKGRYLSFFPGSGGTVNAFNISCTGPGHPSVSCSGLTSSTVMADFGTVFPGVTATAWAPSTSYSYGQYVTAYLTNSQCVGPTCTVPTPGIITATCASNVITYTLSPGQTVLKAGLMFNASSLSTYNVTAATVATANGPGTIITTNSTCSNGTITGQTGTFVQGSNVLFQNVISGTHTSGSGTPSWTGATFSLVPDSGITWIAVGTTNFGQGGGWTTIGGASVAETVFSGGFSNNNFDTTAKGALNVTMSGTQNSGFLVYTYDSVADLYSEWNMGSAIIKTFACTAGTSTVTAWSITSNIATLTATNSYTAGQSIIFSGFISGSAIFNGVTGIVSATGLSSSSFQVALVHANTSGSETTAVGNASGPQCTRGAAGITVLGQVNPTSTTPCTNVAPFSSNTCQMYLHNVKILKGGLWNEITPEFCSSKATGPGNCPTGGKYFWQKSTNTVNMAFVTNGGHETERFTLAENMITNGSNNAFIRQVTAPNVSPGPASFWVNPNTSGVDGHWGSSYLNGSTDDTTITPIAGATDNTTDFPYNAPFESEVLVIPTCGVLTPFTTPACAAGELQASQVGREGHTYASGTPACTFNCQFAVGAFSQDGTIYALTTDWACNLGSSTGGTLFCGFPWSQSFTYANGAEIVPTTAGSHAANLGGFAYQNQSGSSCISGTAQPQPFVQIANTNYAITSVGAPVAGLQQFNGTFPQGGSNGLASTSTTKMSVNTSTFSHGVNNGTFVIGSSTATSISVSNPSGVADTTGIANGPNTQDGTCNWINAGVGNSRSDVILYWLQ